MTSHISVRRLVCLALALPALVIARLRVAFSSQRTLAATIAEARDIVPRRNPPSEAWLRDLAWAICGLARRLPFRTDCLVRVLAAEQLLRGRAEYEIHVQAGRLEHTFMAHAWLTCRGVAVSGGAAPGLHLLEPRATISSV